MVVNRALEAVIKTSLAAISVSILVNVASNVSKLSLKWSNLLCPVVWCVAVAAPVAKSMEPELIFTFTLSEATQSFTTAILVLIVPSKTSLAATSILMALVSASIPVNKAFVAVCKTSLAAISVSILVNVASIVSKSPLKWSNLF